MGRTAAGRKKRARPRHRGNCACAELGAGVQVVRSDAGDAAAQRQLAATAAAAFGKIDIAVLNAGIGVFRPLDAWDEAAFDHSMAVNLKGPFFLVQALLPHLSNPSSVILVGSVNAHIGVPTEVLSWMRALPKTEAHVLDAGHLLLETHAAQAASLMLEFIRRTRESAERGAS